MENYKHVYDAYGNLAAEQIKIFLESEGIEALIIQESYGQTLGLTVGSLGMVKIYVPEEYFETARKLLQDMESGKLIFPDGNDEGNPESENSEK